MPTSDPALSILVNLAQRARQAKRRLRRLRRGEASAYQCDLAREQENEAWNALQASKAVYQRALDRE